MIPFESIHEWHLIVKGDAKSPERGEIEQSPPLGGSLILKMIDANPCVNKTC